MHAPGFHCLADGLQHEVDAGGGVDLRSPLSGGRGGAPPRNLSPLRGPCCDVQSSSAIFLLEVWLALLKRSRGCRSLDWALVLRGVLAVGAVQGLVLDVDVVAGVYDQGRRRGPPQGRWWAPRSRRVPGSRHPTEEEWEVRDTPYSVRDLVGALEVDARWMWPVATKVGVLAVQVEAVEATTGAAPLPVLEEVVLAMTLAAPPFIISGDVLLRNRRVDRLLKRHLGLIEGKVKVQAAGLTSGLHMCKQPSWGRVAPRARAFRPAGVAQRRRPPSGAVAVIRPGRRGPRSPHLPKAGRHCAGPRI